MMIFAIGFVAALLCSIGNSDLHMFCGTVRAAKSTLVTTEPVVGEVRTLEPQEPLYSRANYEILERQAMRIAEDRKLIELQNEADKARMETKDQYPDYRERGITPFERIYRLAIVAIKDDASSLENMLTVDWYNTWKLHLMRIDGDTRSSADLLYAYTQDRRTGKIKGTKFIREFEAQFSSRIFHS